MTASLTADVVPGEAATPRRRWARPLLGYLVTVIILVNLNFLLPRAMPGDPLETLFATAAPTVSIDQETRDELEAYYGLDTSFGEQYVSYFKSLADGDLGRSILTRQEVSDLLRNSLPWTLLLVATATVLATVIGLTAGIHSGWRQGRPVDGGLLIAFLGLRNIPEFFLASALLFLFAVKLDWFPLAGGRTPFTDSSSVEGVLDIAHHLVLPAMVLAIGLTAGQFLYMRAGMVSELGAGYLVMGRAKGLKEHRLKYRYAARNALLPVVTTTSLELGFSITATVFIERVFSYPGMGGVVADAAANRDYPTLQGAFLILAIIVLTINLLTDMLYGRLDPRTKA
ncbi:ABC transporter permease [soil metagenome]